MTDVFTKSMRSRVMSSIRKIDSKPEKIVRKYLHSKGLRYRKNVKNLPGSPDLVLKKYKAIIFVNGCFWHAHHHCKLNRPPKTNKAYWLPKIAMNVERDKKNKVLLNKADWRVISVWECQLKEDNKEKTLKNIINKLIPLTYHLS